MSEIQTKQNMETGTDSGNLFEPEFNNNILTGEEMTKIEETVGPYVSPRHDPLEVSQEVTQLFEEMIEKKMNKINQFIVIKQLAGSDGKKMLLKIAKKIQNPYFIECLITELEAQKHKLNAKFQSHTPK